jgi:hypothetical protein
MQSARLEQCQDPCMPPHMTENAWWNDASMFVLTSRVDVTDRALALADDQHVCTLGHALHHTARSEVSHATSNLRSVCMRQCPQMVGMAAAYLVAICHQVVGAHWIICVGCVFTVAGCRGASMLSVKSLPHAASGVRWSSDTSCMSRRPTTVQQQVKLTKRHEASSTTGR